MPERDDDLIDIDNDIIGLRDTDDIMCSICYENIFPCEVLSLLLCGHYFHYNCIKEWRRHNNICPLCRKHVACTDSDLNTSITSSSSQQSHYGLLQGPSRSVIRRSRKCIIGVSWCIVINYLVFSIILFRIITKQTHSLNTTNI